MRIANFSVESEKGAELLKQLGVPSKLADLVGQFDVINRGWTAVEALPGEPGTIFLSAVNNLGLLRGLCTVLVTLNKGGQVMVAGRPVTSPAQMAQAIWQGAEGAITASRASLEELA